MCYMPIVNSDFCTFLLFKVVFVPSFGDEMCITFYHETFWLNMSSQSHISKHGEQPKIALSNCFFNKIQINMFLLKFLSQFFKFQLTIAQCEFGQRTTNTPWRRHDMQALSSLLTHLKRLHRPLQWRHNGRDSVSNHQPHDCLLNRLFRRRSTKTSKPRVTGLCAGNSPGTGEFPAQMASTAEKVSIWWRDHASVDST